MIKRFINKLYRGKYAYRVALNAPLGFRAVKYVYSISNYKKLEAVSKLKEFTCYKSYIEKSKYYSINDLSEEQYNELIEFMQLALKVFKQYPDSQLIIASSLSSHMHVYFTSESEVELFIKEHNRYVLELCLPKSKEEIELLATDQYQKVRFIKQIKPGKTFKITFVQPLTDEQHEDLLILLANNSDITAMNLEYSRRTYRYQNTTLHTDNEQMLITLRLMFDANSYFVTKYLQRA